MDKKRVKKVCETRWCERHEAVLLFKEILEPIVASLEEIKEKFADQSQKSSFLLNSINKCNFIIAVFVLSKFLGITYTLSKYLQTVNLDIASAIQSVKDVSQVLQNSRQNSDTEFSDVYIQAKNLCDNLNIELIIPRTTKYQKHRCNISTADPEIYYRTSIFNPFIDDLISSLNDRFLKHDTLIISLQYILPDRSNVEYEFIEECIRFYKDDLPEPHEDILKGEWSLWRQKWQTKKDKPKTAIQALRDCDERHFPNIRTLLLILAILPVSTATVERSFSTLKRIKNYLRNSISKDRLNGLALLSIHRDLSTEVDNNAVIDHFQQKSRRLNLTL